MATKAQVKSFFEKLGPLAKQVCEERGYGNASLWTCMAQAACESAYGTATIMANAHAYFGIKANKSWVSAAKYGGLVYNAKTKECYDGKTYTNITACFRAYKSDIDSVRDYFDLIECNRYKESLKATTVLDCITVIKNGGYATSPSYIKTITTIYENSKDLIECYKVGETTKPSTTTAATDEPSKTDVKPSSGNGVKIAYARSRDDKLAGTYKVTASALMLRNAPGTSNVVIRQMPRGTKVKMYGYYTAYCNAKWFLVQCSDGQTGFCHSGWLTKV